MAAGLGKKIRIGMLLIIPILVWQLLDLHSQHGTNVVEKEECDMFSGSWVYDHSLPLYPSCPFVEQGFRCNDNGRPDRSYTKWRWKPSHCHIPRFDPRLILTRFRNKRIALVGDSMGRTQWESLACMLMSGVDDKSSVTLLNNATITKRAPYLAFRFASHNVTLEYHRSPFLVLHTRPPKRAPKRVRSVIRVDKLDPRSDTNWRHADVLVFNTGHWWNPSKTYQMGSYFCLGESVKFGMKLTTAYHTALRTWATWVHNLLLLDTNKTKRVIFRTLEPSHWDAPNKRCSAPNSTSTAPATLLPYNRILQSVVSGINSSSITLLNITALSDVRSDGHIGRWSRGEPPLDCSHWCLPGVPDTWNQLLYATLLNGMKSSA